MFNYDDRSQQLPVAQMTVARPKEKLDEVVRFYRDGIGLGVVGLQEGQEGYSEVMLSLPSRVSHLEFSYNEIDSEPSIPSKDDLLVLYMPDKPAVDGIVKRLGSMGYCPVPAQNSYWARRGTTVQDPDGWKLVLVNTVSAEAGNKKLV